MIGLLRFDEIREGVVESLKAAMSLRRDIAVEAHPGRFDAAELKRLAQRAPAVLTSFMGVGDVGGDNQTLHWATWVITKQAANDKSYAMALQLVSLLIPLLRGLNQGWSNGGAVNIDAQCLHSGSLGDMNATLWAIWWDWPIRGSVAAINPETAQELVGGILVPTSLEPFEGADGHIGIGTQTVEEKLDVEP